MIDAHTLADIRAEIAIQAELIRIQGMLAAVITGHEGGTMKDYCTQNNGDCLTCSLNNYGRDCMNQPIERPADAEPDLDGKDNQDT